MPNIIPPQIYVICDWILSCVDAEQVILFGSYAYGTPREDSDYDFYIVLLDDSPFRPIEVLQKICRHLVQYKMDIPVDVHANYNHRFEALNVLPTMMRTIANKGVLLYDRNGSR